MDKLAQGQSDGPCFDPRAAWRSLGLGDPTARPWPQYERQGLLGWVPPRSHIVPCIHGRPDFAAEPWEAIMKNMPVPNMRVPESNLRSPLPVRP
jgi:hypothetical protein